GVAWAARDFNPQLARNNVELLGAVLTDLVQCATTAGAFLALDIDDDLEARQVCRQRAAVAVGRPCLPPSSPRFCRIFGRLAFVGNLLISLQRKLQLIEVKLLRTRSVPMRSRRWISSRSFSFSACSSGTTSRSICCRTSGSSGSAARSICMPES